MSTNKIETVAYIVKEERIVSVDHLIRPGTMVVEPVEPYPGYHGLNIPDESNQVPHDIFLITKKRNASEQIAHITRRVLESSGVDFSAARTELFFFNETYPGIRIRGLESYNQIENLQNWYADSGIGFAKKQKLDTKAVIKIQKMLCAEEMWDGIWQDLENEEMRYFEIPREISWQQFAQITLKIKRSSIDRNHDTNYDVALGGIFRRTGLVDMIRVYSNKTENLEKIRDIQKMFVSEIEKL